MSNSIKMIMKQKFTDDNSFPLVIYFRNFYIDPKFGL